jgi:hypothetical protein
MQVVYFPEVSPAEPCMHFSPHYCHVSVSLTSPPLTALIVFDAEYQPCSAPLRSCHRLPDNSSHLHPNIFHRILWRSSYAIYSQRLCSVCGLEIKNRFPEITAWHFQILISIHHSVNQTSCLVCDLCKLAVPPACFVDRNEGNKATEKEVQTETCNTEKR